VKVPVASVPALKTAWSPAVKGVELMEPWLDAHHEDAPAWSQVPDGAEPPAPAVLPLMSHHLLPAWAEVSHSARKMRAAMELKCVLINCCFQSDGQSALPVFEIKVKQ
jgi:hypothetical protein